MVSQAEHADRDSPPGRAGWARSDPSGRPGWGVIVYADHAPALETDLEPWAAVSGVICETHLEEFVAFMPPLTGSSSQWRPAARPGFPAASREGLPPNSP